MDTSACSSCGQLILKERLAEYTTEIFGPKMTLLNAVSAYKCENCDRKSIDIPNKEGLVAAAAVTRASMPERLTGTEIRFLRKAMQVPAKGLAKALEVTPETVSRWENNKTPINPGSEKLLRLTVVANLSESAPAVRVQLKDITTMEFTGFAHNEAVHLCFELVKLSVEKDPDLKDAYARDRAA